MKVILGCTNDLSVALQQKDQDVVNALNLVKASKSQLQGFEMMIKKEVLQETIKFCQKHEIGVLDMKAEHLPCGRPSTKGNKVKDSFMVYEQEKLVKLAMLYQKDFMAYELEHLKPQIEMIIHNVQNDAAMCDKEKVKSLNDLSQEISC